MEPKAPVTVSDELGVCEHSLAKAYSSFTMDNRPTAFDHQLIFFSDSGSKSNVTQPYDNGSVEAARSTPLFSGKMLDGSKLGTFNQYGLLYKAVAPRESQYLLESWWGAGTESAVSWVAVSNGLAYFREPHLDQGSRKGPQPISGCVVFRRVPKVWTHTRKPKVFPYPTNARIGSWELKLEHDCPDKT